MYPDDYLNKEDDKGVYWFSSPFDALNNWSANAVNFNGIRFQTIEHAYHYRKFIDDYPEIAKEIIDAPSPWKAFQIARNYNNNRRKDWDNVKVKFMEELLRLKLEQNEDVQESLVRTGKRMIYEK